MQTHISCGVPVAKGNHAANRSPAKCKLDVASGLGRDEVEGVT